MQKNWHCVPLCGVLSSIHTPNHSHAARTSQPFPAFLQCIYRSAFPVEKKNCFNPLNSFTYKKPKTYLSNYKPHVPPLNSGCS